ncbi:MAG: hypothetical protein HOP10_02030 [Chitinophagaceae bacterium]|nr:hypothetical protein [Chitinophagaceae bacterium]
MSDEQIVQPEEDASDINGKDRNSFEVAKSFLVQFSQNTNHNQSLFIQFLASVIIVLIGYAFVYSNTSGHSSYRHSNTTVISYPDSLRILPPIEARPFESIKNENGDILTYGLIHLVIIYLFAQMVLIILGILNLHIGYSFRRDQVSVNKIRADYLGDEKHKKYFYHYSGLNKKIYNYLPNFNSILFGGIFIIQILLYISIFVFFDSFDPGKVFISYLVVADISYYQAKIALGFPFILSTFCYVVYFIKYNKKVNNLEFYRNLSIVKVTHKQTLYAIGIASTAIAGLLVALWYNIRLAGLLSASVLIFGNAIACFFSSYLQIKAERRKAKGILKENSSSVFKLVIHGGIFLIASALIFFSFFIPYEKDPALLVHYRVTIFLLLTFILVMTAISYMVKREYIYKDLDYKLKTLIKKQLEIGGYMLTFLLVSCVLVHYFGSWWIDKYLVRIVIGSLGFIWGIRRIATAMDMAMNRKEIEHV